MGGRAFVSSSAAVTHPSITIDVAASIGDRANEGVRMRVADAVEGIDSAGIQKGVCRGLPLIEPRIKACIHRRCHDACAASRSSTHTSVVHHILYPTHPEPRA